MRGHHLISLQLAYASGLSVCLSFCLWNRKESEREALCLSRLARDPIGLG